MRERIRIHRSGTFRTTTCLFEIKGSAMTTVPFKCEKTGAAFLPHEGGHCGLCRRLLLTRFLHTQMFPRQAAPICSDCVADLQAIAKGNNWPRPWIP
ncbi:hypothetical protein [Roseateles chitinivorans]|uniref:hypothetical protein n=1 Tax=Roseateles chitinivorans TaxID=2917965 RepID=UPI003D679F7F